MTEYHEFDDPAKSRGWHTAFYYLSRHLGKASVGKLTNAELYGMVGVQGRMYNHPNQRARRKLAGELSRTVHSNKYARDMRELYTQDASTFAAAGDAICQTVASTRGWDDADLKAWLRTTCWPDVRRGLANEKADCRPALDLYRIDREAELVFGPALTAQDAPDERHLSASTMLAAILHIMAFGFLDIAFMAVLVPGTVQSGQGNAFYQGCASPCLVRYADESCSVFIAEWDLPDEGDFTIGRRTDCSSIETDAHVGSFHGRVYRLGGAWYYEDMRSLNGSTVVRSGTRIECHVDRKTDDEVEPVALEPGDLIVVAQGSCYWFGERKRQKP